MPVNIVNPGSTVLDQVQEHWQTIAALLVWKLARDGVRITYADMEAFAKEADAGRATLLTHGHQDAIEFKLVTAERARELAEWDAKQRGSA